MDAEALQNEARSAIEGASSLAELDELRVRYLGRRSPLKLALREVRDRETGIRLNAAREAIEEALSARSSLLERALIDRRLSEEIIDVTLPGEGARRGRLHLITQVRREVEDIFLGLGYQVVDGREVETTRYNFDGLNFPPGHPTRSPLQSLFLNGDVLLRTETSPSQIRVMEQQEPPVYMVSLGRVYRRDTPDATHSPIFHQVEGLAVERDVRFRTHDFPFTEPSLEPDVSCFLCEGEGCPVCRWSGWIELGGSGMVDPNVFEFVGYDPEEWTGFAFGIGLERIAQLRHGLPEIGGLWQNDLRLLRQF